MAKLAKKNPDNGKPNIENSIINICGNIANGKKEEKLRSLVSITLE